MRDPGNLPDTPRWRVATELAVQIRRRWPADIAAIGIHGSMAHGDDSDASDVDLVVLTYRPRTGPHPGTRQIDGVIVDLSVIGAQEYVSHASTLSTSWPLAADQYLTTTAIHDPEGWHERLRDTHLSRLASSTGREFATLGREAWCNARSLHARTIRLAEWHDTGGALIVLGETRVAAAVVDGLLSRTYFRSSVDAVHKTGLADADLGSLTARLDAQATELARRGRPVDGTIADLLER